MPKVKRFEAPIYVGLTPEQLEYVKWRARFCSSMSEWVRSFIQATMDEDKNWKKIEPFIHCLRTKK